MFKRKVDVDKSLSSSMIVLEKGGMLTMIGGIYSDQQCPICKGRFRDDGRKGLFCPDHPQCQANRFKVKFKGVYRRFKDYDRAQRWLVGLRFQYDNGNFDPRDYRKDNPLGFETLALRFLEIKKDEIDSYRHAENHIYKATNYWGNTNIKDIQYGDLEDFLLVKTERAREILSNQKTGELLSAKTRANVKATLHSFWGWLRKRRVLRLDQIPEFPEVPFELGWRKIVDKATQQSILEEVRRLSEPVNIKIWIAIKWLCTYISIRPKELRDIKEGDFEFDLKAVFIRSPKGKRGEKKSKIVPLLDEDIELIQSFPTGLPHLYFFRHGKGLKGVKVGEPFGNRLLYKYWKKACSNLNIVGVDLYGGTKHSSATALRKHRSPEQIKRATMHSTNKAFDRYFRLEMDDVRDIYADTHLTPNKVSPKKGQVIDIINK